MSIKIVQQEEAEKEIIQWKKLETVLKGASLNDILFLGTKKDLVVGFIKSIRSNGVVLSHENQGTYYYPGDKKNLSTSLTKGDRFYCYYSSGFSSDRNFSKYRVNLPEKVEQAEWQGTPLKNVDYGDLLLFTNNSTNPLPKVIGFVKRIEQDYVTLSYEHPSNISPHTIRRDRDYLIAKSIYSYKVVKLDEIMEGDIVEEERKKKEVKEETKSEGETKPAEKTEGREK
jgi:hypothetical protein